VQGGDRMTVDLLLKAGTNVNHADTSSWTALIYASAGDGSILERLMDANSHGHHVAIDGAAALTRASARVLSTSSSWSKPTFAFEPSSAMDSSHRAKPQDSRGIYDHEQQVPAG